jgi:hypothetical protein
MAKFTREDALEYHRLKGKPGKVAIVPTKPMDTQRDKNQLEQLWSSGRAPWKNWA